MADIYEPTAHSADTSVSSAIASIAKCAARFARSMVFSIEFMPSALAQNFLQLLTPDSLWALALVLAGWAIATVIGGLVGLAVNGVLLAYGLWSLYEQLAATWGLLKEWAALAYHAKDDGELMESARLFAEAVGQGAITLLEVILTHRVFRAVEGSLRRRFPTPDWLESEWESARRKRQEANRGPTEVVRKVTEGIGEAARARAIRKAPQSFPTSLVLGGVIGVATLTTVALVATSRDKRRG